MKRTVVLASCLMLMVSGAALAAATPGWKTGVVRDVESNYAHVATKERNGEPLFRGTGPITQYCTIEVGRQLVVVERQWQTPAQEDRFSISNEEGVQLRIEGDHVIVRDAFGNDASFHIVKTLADTPANQPDRTAFAERPLIIQ